MSSAPMSAIDSVRSRGDFLVLLLVLAVFIIAAALQFLYILPNHDSIWLLIAAERMLEGGTYERDFSELNPPLAILVHAPAFLISAISGLSPYFSYTVLSFIYTGSTLVLLRKVVVNGFPPASELRLWLPLVAALLILLLPRYDFGQREHLISIFIIPYLALHSTTLPQRPQFRRLTILISAWACLGLFLKPVFLLLPILISLDHAIRQRSLRSLFSLDMITIGAMGLVYTAAVLIYFPDYFIFVRYALEFYGAYNNNFILVALVAVLYVLVAIALAFFAVRVTESPEDRRMFILLTFAAGIAAGSVIMQQKGWGYHMLPVRIFVGVSGVMLAVIAGGRIRRGTPNRTFALLAKAAPFIIAALLLDPVGWTTEQWTRQNLAKTELYPELETVAADKRFYVFTAAVWVGTPWVASINAKWTSRFPCLWLLPGYVAAIDNGTLSAARQEQVAGDIRRFVAEDFERHRPEVVLVDRREYKQGFKRPFEFMDFFLASERFAMIWKSYSFHKTTDGIDIYLLSGQTDAGGSTVGQ